MIDLANGCSRALAAGASLGQTGLRLLETISASGAVIAARTPIINRAILSPLTGNHKELARMVPEKIDAFSSAGSASMAGWLTAHAAWTAHMQHLGAMAMRGRAPTMSEMIDLQERSGAIWLETMEGAAQAGSNVLAPVHHKATANAHRLGKKTRA